MKRIPYTQILTFLLLPISAWGANNEKFIAVVKDLKKEEDGFGYISIVNRRDDADTKVSEAFGKNIEKVIENVSWTPLFLQKEYTAFLYYFFSGVGGDDSTKEAFLNKVFSKEKSAINDINTTHIIDFLEAPIIAGDINNLDSYYSKTIRGIINRIINTSNNVSKEDLLKKAIEQKKWTAFTALLNVETIIEEISDLLKKKRLTRCNGDGTCDHTNHKGSEAFSYKFKN
ncbi:MAG: hypothetical protein AAF335_04365 [Bacteroidota bacterium]